MDQEKPSWRSAQHRRPGAPSQSPLPTAKGANSPLHQPAAPQPLSLASAAQFEPPSRNAYLPAAHHRMADHQSWPSRPAPTGCRPARQAEPTLALAHYPTDKRHLDLSTPAGETCLPHARPGPPNFDSHNWGNRAHSSHTVAVVLNCPIPRGTTVGWKASGSSLSYPAPNVLAPAK